MSDKTGRITTYLFGITTAQRVPYNAPECMSIYWRGQEIVKRQEVPT